MAAIHWKDDFKSLKSEFLLPKKLPTELLISVARSMAMYKDGALDRKEMKGVWELLQCWIERLLDAQDVERLVLFKKHTSVMLPLLADELDFWVRMEVVSRQIDYAAYELTLATVFNNQFEEFAETFKAANV
jgi:hypothetical protein